MGDATGVMRAPPRGGGRAVARGCLVRIACSAASPRAGAPIGVGTVGAVADDVDAEHADDGVHRLLAVGRRLDERERIDRRAVAAAGAVALAVQRAEAGERGEADRQPRKRSRPPSTRPTRRRAAVSRTARRGPPRGAAGRVAGTDGARVDEQRRVRRFEHVEQRREALEPVRAARARRRRPRVRSRRARARRGARGVGLLDAGHRPGAERRPQRQRALEPCAGELLGLSGREPVEP